MEARLTEGIREFVYGGNATFTLVNSATGNRLTFRVVQARPRDGESRTPDTFFVSVLTGPQNMTDYSFLGTVFGAGVGHARYVHSRKSRITQDAQSARTADWLVRKLDNGGLPVTVEFWHMGRCGRCGRPLTDPESIRIGIGPKCLEE